MSWIGFTVLVSLGVLHAAWLGRGRPGELPVDRWATRSRVATALTWIAFAACLGLATRQLLALDIEVICVWPTPLLRVAMVRALLAAALSVVLAGSAVAVWRHGSWPVRRRIRHSLVALVSVLTVVVLYDLNMIGFRF